ncbi:metalloregulator ArsR/SmtB family transcription factor [Hassallia byssoidea VB512170]|uniref:Metalloregulator ArsR/SmtB family transcription factor n=1 Tax=Hassallia byssoidea VB512170 TaxID=1304833 RepID=A0A846H5S7_9CYAN|nr:metalloregulator ArsR/SmtB family transcription factor [Hassalia byssoidea]NEU71931.1 metalloregulator ArsR/SmtB family transcription factor [Hassalia byssoidea VB512170]
MQKESFPILLRFFKALADDSRLKIVGILANQECSVEELALLLHLKEPTISHHLTKLNELNLVKMRSSGNTQLYKLDSEILQSFSKEIFTSVEITSVVEDEESQVWSNKVLKNYISSDRTNSHPRLKEIPASRKKRLVILKWLANNFEIKVNYPESKVNEILKRYHPDCATLRRELICHQLMQRENGIYWRQLGL